MTSNNKHTGKGCPPGYEVTEDGRVFSCASNWRGYGRNLLTPVLDDDGYEAVRMNVDGARRKFRVHRLVAETFIPTADVGLQIRHLDGNKRNNSVANLAWGTAAENAADRARHGTTSKGPGHSAKVRKLADQNARLIAAAPDLLEACEVAERFMRHLDVDAGDYSAFYGDFNRIVAAIKKARGES